METLNLERCPVRPTLDVLGGKWKPVIIYHLIHDGTLRFGQLRRFLPDATQKMLTQQLRELERDGIVARKIYHQVPPKVEYSLTPHGRTLAPVMAELCKWGQKHRSQMRAKRSPPIKEASEGSRDRNKTEGNGKQRTARSSIS
jgi:DNA-binding HxlR family transcriptional regulator